MLRSSRAALLGGGCLALALLLMIRASNFGAATDDPGAEVTERILVVPVLYPQKSGLPPTPLMTPDRMQEELFGRVTTSGAVVGAASFPDWLDEITYGAYDVNGTVTDTVIHGVAPTMYASQCQPWSSYSPDGATIEDILDEAGYGSLADIEDYDVIAFIQQCDIGTTRGRAFGSPTSVFGQDFRVLLASHENGPDHALAFWDDESVPYMSTMARNLLHEYLHSAISGPTMEHAKRLDCPESVLAGDCTVENYGDPFSIMGNPTGVFGLNVLRRIHLGALTYSDIHLIEESGTYTIGSINDAASAKKGALIYWPGSNKPHFLVQHRTADGFDAFLGDEWLSHVVDGVTVHAVPRMSLDPISETTRWNASSPNPMITGPSEDSMGNAHRKTWYALDFSPDSDSSNALFDHQSALTGIWDDEYSGISIEVIEVDDDGATIEVTIPNIEHPTATIENDIPLATVLPIEGAHPRCRISTEATVVSTSGLPEGSEVDFRIKQDSPADTTASVINSLPLGEITELELTSSDDFVSTGVVDVAVQSLWAYPGSGLRNIATKIEICRCFLGDVNADGMVNSADLLIMLSAFGTPGEVEYYVVDTDGDGVVAVSDLIALLSDWNLVEWEDCPIETATVPESEEA